jgi:predicted small metal-binding protein
MTPAHHRTRENIMKQFACGTVVDGCDGVVTGETEDDVLAAAAHHAAEAHGMTEVPPEIAGAIRAGITDA